MSELLEYQQDATRLQAALTDGLLCGEMQIEEHGRRLMAMHYQQGILHGVTESWHPNGQLAMHQEYHHGRLQGVARYFSEEGVLIREEHWREGQLHGECRCFYPSGQMQMRTVAGRPASSTE